MHYVLVHTDGEVMCQWDGGCFACYFTQDPTAPIPQHLAEFSLVWVPDARIMVQVAKDLLT